MDNKFLFNFSYALLIPTMLVLFSATGCEYKDRPINRPKGAKFSCVEYLAQQPEALRPYYDDLFSRYGAFLSYYDNKITELGPEAAKREIDNLGPFLPQNDEKSYFGITLKDAIAKADALKDPGLQKYWSSWCENPGNFVSYFSEGFALKKPIPDEPLPLLQDFYKIGSRSRWIDSWIFLRWATGLREAGAWKGIKPDPTKWHIKKS